MKTSVETPYGTLSVGDRYVAADGSGHEVVVTDVETYEDCHDVVVMGIVPYRIDWFKFMMVRYKKV